MEVFRTTDYEELMRKVKELREQGKKVQVFVQGNMFIVEVVDESQENQKK